MSLNAEHKRQLKALLIQALVAKLPITWSGYNLEAAPSSGEDVFLNIKVRDGANNLLTYLEVKVKETI